MLMVCAAIPIRVDAAPMFAEAGRDLVIAARAEPGCVDYLVTVDSMDAALVRIVEVWEDTAAFLAYTRTEYTAEFAARTREGRTGVTQVTIWQGATLYQGQAPPRDGLARLLSSDND
jgi:quinol monooxygenase YgiN